eukprot:TRINITY_DN10604_c0_g1_i1.p1 TRINITY_DN10604_c0_g1~~TRINITY_DN10604_c0_g1_i1.p1  ORF type:complete len:551 (-),score=87.52 TRINITY_DN10604_c0_g1_i1:114-1766(-)
MISSIKWEDERSSTVQQLLTSEVNRARYATWIIELDFAMCLIFKTETDLLIQGIQRKVRVHLNNKNNFAAIREYEKAEEKNYPIEGYRLKLLKIDVLLELKRYGSALEATQEVLNFPNLPLEVQQRANELNAKARDGYNALQAIIDHNHEQCMYALYYDVLQNVFSHLSARDLVAASKVCNLWHDAAFRRLKQLSALSTRKSSIPFFELNGMIEAIFIDAICHGDIDKYQSILYNFPHSLRQLRIKGLPFGHFLIREFEVRPQHSASMFALFKKALEMGLDVLLPVKLLVFVLRSSIKPEWIVKIAELAVQHGADFDAECSFIVMKTKELSPLRIYIDVDDNLYKYTLKQQPNPAALQYLISTMRYCTPAEFLLDFLKMDVVTKCGVTGATLPPSTCDSLWSKELLCLLHSYFMKPGSLTDALNHRDKYGFSAYDWAIIRESIDPFISLSKDFRELASSMNEVLPSPIAWVCKRCLVLRDNNLDNVCTHHGGFQVDSHWSCCWGLYGERWEGGCSKHQGHEWIPNDKSAVETKRKKRQRRNRRGRNKTNK